ncbi:hypothetical protein B0H13DRAFT_2247444 [Mycena leptocephala]|nr:hypothetical protein B0H13DRAFT_2247444 [Mycena leptocephala]
MDKRPDRPLVVKCTFDRWNKRITFNSLVEQCFSLYATSYAIAYKDDDGEVTDITTDSDLTEAIQYFQAGGDDPPLSSAASILSGRSFGTKKITLRVTITVDYDGPSLSDTSSLASLEEYKNRNGSQQSFSFGAPTVDLDDDSITVSSRDAISRAERPVRNGSSQASAQSWDLLSQSEFSNPQAGPSTTLRFQSNATDPFADEQSKPVSGLPEDPAAVFERLKLQESIPDDSSSFQGDNLRENDRGAAWLRDQNARAIRSRLGALPEPSISSGLGGALALEQDPRGKYYYSYTSSSVSQTHANVNEFQRQPKPRPSSRQLNWLAAQQAVSAASSQSGHKPPPSVEPFQAEAHDHSPDQPYTSNTIPRELLQFLPLNPPAPETLTDCSECGVLLDSIRYKKPASQSNKGKGRSLHTHYEHVPHEHEYPPQPHYHDTSPSSSRPFLGVSRSTESLTGSIRHFKPLPRLPGLHGSTRSAFSSQATLVPPGYVPDDPGYELCSGCLEHAGVTHAIEAGLSPGSASPSVSPSSPADAQRALEWRRLAPKKGQTRHAYHEKVWGPLGWEDVEQDENEIHQCSTCAAITDHHRYKCASCKKFNLCRACYSQVHDLHPSHAFLVVPDLPVQSSNDSELFETIPPDLGPEGEKSSLSCQVYGPDLHSCMLDIVGARFHCAICDAVDICANCESAGLPGNLDSSDGGHNSSHILIKADEVQTASRRAIHLWQGRDAASVGQPPPKPSKAASVVSSYARTVIGSGTRLPRTRTIIPFVTGVETTLVTLHDPGHIFFKLPRPVQRPLISPFALLPRLSVFSLPGATQLMSSFPRRYKSPAGPPPGMDPHTYLSSLQHTAALCDRCMSGIQGVWFRCAYAV